MLSESEIRGKTNESSTFGWNFRRKKLIIFSENYNIFYAN